MSKHLTIRDQILTLSDSQSLPTEHLHLMVQYTKIILCHKLSQFLKLTPNITHLKLDDEFNKSIYLTKHMVFFDSGYKFNHPIKLNKYLKSLTLGFRFNRKLKLTPNIKQLSLSTKFNQPIHLTRKIIYLYISYNFKQPIVLSKNIKYLVVYGNPCNTKMFFPKHLTHIDFPNYAGNLILPKFIQTLNFEYNCVNTYAFEYPIDKFTVWIEHFTWKYLPDDLPDCIKTVIINSPWKNIIVHNKPSRTNVMTDKGHTMPEYNDPEDFTKYII